MNTRILIMLPVVMISLPVHLSADDWPMLGRDSSRNAVSTEKNPPTQWQVAVDDKKEKNIKWVVKLGNYSSGTPVIANGLVWVGTNNNHPRDQGKTGDASVLMCFRESDGKFLYQYVSPRLPSSENDIPGVSLASSPLIEKDQLWFCTNRCEIVCLDISPLQKKQNPAPAKVLWKLNMIKELGVYPCGGFCAGANNSNIQSSIASYKNYIYVNTSNGRSREEKKVMAPNAPSLLCVHKHTGKVIWQDNSPGKNILDVQWGSPLVVEVLGSPQVIAGQGDGWLRSFHGLTGKLLWQFDMNKKNTVWRNHGRGNRNCLLATPVYFNNRIYLAVGKRIEFGDGPGRLCCVNPTRRGDISAELPDGPKKGKPNPYSGLIWEFDARDRKENRRMYTSLSSVAIKNGLVIATDIYGLVHCLNAKTGKAYWHYDTLSEIRSSPLLVEDKVYITTADGEVIILQLTKKMKKIATYDMYDSIHASPVYANGVLYITTNRHLYAIHNKSQ